MVDTGTELNAAYPEKRRVILGKTIDASRRCQRKSHGEGQTWRSGPADTPFQSAPIEALLPPGVKPAATNTVGLSHYVVREGAGLAPYEATYLFAEVDGYDDPAGGKARWFLWGLYSPDRAVAALREVIGFAPRLGTTKVMESGKRVRGAGSRDGKEVLSSELNVKSDPAVSAGGILHYPQLRTQPTVLGAIGSSELVLTRIAWTAKVQMAEPIARSEGSRSRETRRNHGP